MQENGRGSQAKTHLYDVDDVIGQPEQGEGTDDEQDEAAALGPALELGALQAADDRGIAGVDECERQQAAHDGLEQVLEDPMAYASPVVWDAEGQRDIFCYNLVESAKEGNTQTNKKQIENSDSIDNESFLLIMILS